MKNIKAYLILSIFIILSGIYSFYAGINLKDTIILFVLIYVGTSFFWMIPKDNKDNKDNKNV